MPKPLPSGGEVTSAFLNDLTGVYDRDGAEVDVNTTTAETSLYSKVVTGGDMSTDRMLRCTIGGDYLNNTGSGQVITLKFKFGAAVVGHAVTIFAGSTRYPLELTVEVRNLGATNANFMKAFWTSPTAATGGATAASEGGVVAIVTPISIVSAGDLAVDTSVDQTFEITVQHGASSASLSCRKKHAILELL